jgi:hypothetical protein
MIARVNLQFQTIDDCLVGIGGIGMHEATGKKADNQDKTFIVGV